MHAQLAITNEWRGAVGFEKADRTAIYVKRADSAVKVLLQSTPPLLTMSNLALLDVSPDGMHYLIAGKFTYYKVGPNQFVTYIGIVSIPANLDLTATNAISQVHFLKVAQGNIGVAFRPLGLISNDGNDWFAVMESGSTGTLPLLTFYHGKMDQDETTPGTVIDSAQAPLSDHLTDWHMSNLALAGGDLVAITVQAIGDVPSLEYHRYRWAWSDNVSIPPRQLYMSSWGNLVSRAPRPSSNTDTLFGYCLQIVGNEAHVGTMNSSGDIDYWKLVPYSGTGQPQDGGPLLSRTDLPKDQTFFAGSKMGPYGENIPDACNPGMGGDISFSRGGDSITFITHPAADSDVARRNKRSGVWLTTGGSTTLIYNDTNAQELQPVIMKVAVGIPHYGGIKLGGSDPIVYQTIDTGTTHTYNLQIADTSAYVDDTINSVVLSGTNASEFSVGGTFPVLAPMGGNSISIPITFAPTGLAGARTATVTVHFAKDSIRTVGISATASVKAPAKGVKEDPTLAALVSVEPNPFTSSTSVLLTAAESGTLGIAVHDAVGRTVYTSELRRVGAGASEAFTFDAKSLGLPDGVYYVSALFGDREVSRRVVYVR